MTQYTFDENTVSDLHKDAYGYRTSMYWFENNWNNASDDQKQVVWDDLCVDLERSMNEEKEAAEYAVKIFDQLVEKTIGLGAGDRMTALRWITTSDCKMTDIQDVDQFVWQQGFLFTEDGKQLVDELRWIWGV